MTLIGLLITKDDNSIIGEWCYDQLPLYDAVVCLDGSESDETERQLRGRGDRGVYLHERDFVIPYKTDHGLRRIVHEEIVRRFGTDNWVMCCHADEFCYHDPRKIVRVAEASGFDLVSWFSLQFFPHPDDHFALSAPQVLSIRKSFLHYHWSFRGDGFPWLEDRLYRNGPHVSWDQVTHGSVRPHGLNLPAPFHPALCHYKVLSLEIEQYEPSGNATFYKSHWQGLPDRTGLPFAVRSANDLRVKSVPDYDRCDRFDGVFPHAWNIGEEYRPDVRASNDEDRRIAGK